MFESKLACHLVCLFLSTTELPMEEKNTITKIIDTPPCLCTKSMILIYDRDQKWEYTPDAPQVT
jgi:hypothetical protein